jgi:hypothetical protein
MTMIFTDPENTYGLWHPKADGQRNGREAGLSLMTASAEQVAAMSAKIEAGKVEALQMLDSRNICEVSIGAYHAAFYAELETWVAKATAQAPA